MERKLPFDSTFSDKMKLALFLTTPSNAQNGHTLNQIHNDTLFVFSNTSVDPILVLKEGKYKIPDSELINFIEHRKKRSEFVMLGTIDCFSNYALIKYTYNGYLYVNVWDLKEEEILCNFLLKDIIKNEGIKGGITYNMNDNTSIDILPRYITEKELAFIILTSDLLDEFPYLEEDDNPILMILKLR